MPLHHPIPVTAAPTPHLGLPIQSCRVGCVCPDCTGQLPSHYSMWLVLYIKSSCHPAVVVSPEGPGPSEGWAVKQASFKLKQQPSLHLWLGHHFPGYSTSTERVSSRIFL